MLLWQIILKALTGLKAIRMFFNRICYCKAYHFQMDGPPFLSHFISACCRFMPCLWPLGSYYMRVCGCWCMCPCESVWLNVCAPTSSQEISTLQYFGKGTADPKTSS